MIAFKRSGIAILGEHPFPQDGAPRYYDHKTQPIDIQRCSEAIGTLVFFHDHDPRSLLLALKVAN